MPLLFAYDIRHIFSWPGSFIFKIKKKSVEELSIQLYVFVILLTSCETVTFTFSVNASINLNQCTVIQCKDSKICLD